MKINAISIFGLALAFSVQAQASSNASFNVTTSFTPSCKLVSATTPALAFGVYTPFGAAATPSPTTSIAVSCSRGLTVSGVTFDTGAYKTSSQYQSVTQGEGLVAGLKYSMTVGSPTRTAGTAATAGAGGVGGSVGTPDTVTYTVSGSIAAGQAGCDTSITENCTVSQSRALVIAY